MSAAHGLAAVVAVLLAIDWAQTLTIARNPRRWHEVNVILGQHPSAAKVNVYFAAVFAAFAAAVYFVTGTPLLVGLLVALAVEAICVVNNHQVGIRP